MMICATPATRQSAAGERIGTAGGAGVGLFWSAIGVGGDGCE